MLNRDWITGKRRCLILAAHLALAICCSDRTGFARADDTVKATGTLEVTGAEGGEFHALLAGEQRQATFLGETIDIPAEDRSRVTSLTLGGSLLEPRQGGTRGLPIIALYLRRTGEDSRTRGVISLFVNELEHDRREGLLELVSHFENFTLPGDQTEVRDGQEIQQTSLTWGTFMGSLGVGLRIPVAPYQVDNDFRIQLLGRAGYFYALRTKDTGADLVSPPNTALYGVRLRGRYDGLRRNLLELPHEGMAAGWDLDLLHRDRWRDLTGGTTGEKNRDYLQMSGYLVGAGGIPGLSERDRLLASLYGGKTSKGGADPFSAFRINGGPFPSEADDLARACYSGLLYDDIPATSYAMATLGYRRELTFFLYLSLVGSYLWADRATVQGVDQVVFRNRQGRTATVSLDSAFFWKSEIYLAYAWESGVIRGGKAGSGIILNWNKSF